MKTISIVIPVYNEEKFIQKTIEKVLQADTIGFKKEIIIVDDCSTDETATKIKYQISLLRQGFEGQVKLKQTNQNSKLIRYKNETILKNNIFSIQLIEKKQNEGKGSALKIGFLKSKGDIVIVQDADLEYSPDDYPILLEPFIKQNADVVYGSRFISNRPHRVLYFWHSVINNYLTMLSNMLTNLNLTDMETGFKVFKGDLIRGVAQKLESKKFGFEPEITARIAKIKLIKIYEVGISYQGRTYEEGKKIGWKDGIKAIGEIIKYNL